MNNNRSEIKRAYKENPPMAGIFKITNKKSGKMYIDKGMNAQGVMNRHEFQLRNGGHSNQGLQSDWEQYGESSFSFEIIDQIKPSNDPSFNMAEELAALETVWLGELKPYGEKGYNSLP